MKQLFVQDIKNMLIGGAQFLEINKEYVDSLNVFPVPDGDTGTNMFMTVISAVHEIQSLDTQEIDVLMQAFAKGALRGARGNSGVILSQIFKGLSDELSDNQEITTKTLYQALMRATDVAYSAVTKPKEGTILTVIRYMAEQSKSIYKRNSHVDQFLKEVIQKGEEILEKTPDMLPVLKQAGVVDAGGRGLLCVFQGMFNALTGVKMEALKVSSTDTLSITDPAYMSYNSNDAIINSLGEIKFGYCTEYFVVQIKPTVTEEDIAKLRDKLQTIGDSVICIGDLSLIKVHVHTNQPNKALNMALQLGELDKIKIENMRQQNREIKKAMENRERKEIAMMTICVGDGLKKMFKELAVDEIIEGGQTMNPSVEDILSYVNKINSDNIIILPNNKNIILAANQAKELTDKNLSIIPTINIPQGIRAALAFDPTASIDDNSEEMREAIANTKYGQVTYAVRTTTMDGFDLNEGDIIGLDDKHIISKGDSVDDVVLALVSKLVDDDSDVVSLYYGDKVKKEEAEVLKERLEEEFPDLEVILYEGGQPHYFYIMSVE